MQLSLKFFITKSGKSVILQVENKKYLFNIFEGFQRYCIERSESLSTIRNIFITSRDNVIPLMGMYLTLNDIPEMDLNIYSTFDLNFFGIHKFAISDGLKINFLKNFRDDDLSIKMFDSGECTNFILQIKDIEGSLHPERIPASLPKKLYKTLISEKIIYYNDIQYNIDEYADKDIRVPRIGFVFSHDAFDSIIESFSALDAIFCFNEAAYSFFENHNNHQSDSSFGGVYLISDSLVGDYHQFIEIQRQHNRLDKNFQLPVSQTDCFESNRIIKTGDAFHFSKLKGFDLIRNLSNSIEEAIKYEHALPCLEFLGTGCAMPSKFRNVSSILYENEDSAILLDVGEDTYGQILRLRGNLNVLKKVKLIYLSHNHADHVIGLNKILKECTQDVLILGSGYIHLYLKYFEFDFHVLGFDLNLKPGINFFNKDFVKSLEQQYYEQVSATDLDQFCYTMKFASFEIKICGCPHSSNSTSIAIYDYSNKKSFSYSGDTIPSSLFAHISKDTDVMIHEASFNADQYLQAYQFFHSTREDAIELFQNTNSKKLLLTHFSNRNAKDGLQEFSVTDFFKYTFD